MQVYCLQTYELCLCLWAGWLFGIQVQEIHLHSGMLSAELAFAEMC